MSDPLNKAAIWHRVKDEGRLAEFDARREEIRTELKEKGTKRKEAADQAWRIAADEFPPAESPPVVDNGGDENDGVLELDESMLPTPPPYDGSDVMWVYHRMPAQWTEENDAPNKGCWGLLQWARRNRGAFYGQMLPKVFQAHAKEAEEQKVWVESEPKTVEERLAIYTECMDRYEAERKRRGLGDMELLNAHRSRRHCLPHATS